ncbi:2'-5' RNA ligase family protein [Streptomyces sp. NBC_00510]
MLSLFSGDVLALVDDRGRVIEEGDLRLKVVNVLHGQARHEGHPRRRQPGRRIARWCSSSSSRLRTAGGRSLEPHLAALVRSGAGFEVSHDKPRAGQTALLATVAEAEPLVGHWRRRFDASASAGIPVHVTVLFPFLDVDLITTAVISDLKVLIGKHSPFTVRFDECRRFPDVLYLAPTPHQPLRLLTETVAARWPEAPPCGGQFTEVIPHLTVAYGQQPRVFDEVEAELAQRLPVTATISSVSLLVSDGENWRHHADFPMLG